MGDTAQRMLNSDGKANFKNVSSKITQYIAAATAGIAAIVAGTILGWTSPVLEQIKVNSTQSQNSSLLITEEEASWVGSIVAIGAFALALPVGMLADLIGRKFSILSLVIPFLLNWLLIIFASNVGMLYAARFFGGIATGAICVTAPMYIGEIAETSIRGVLGSFFQLFLTIGILFTYVVGGYTDWRTLSIVSAAIPVIFAVLFFFMPETPQYLLKKNRLKDAEKSLRWLRGDNYDLSMEIEDMQREVDYASKNKASIKDLITVKANRNALLCSLGLMFFQQVSGINAVIFYTNDIFQSAGSTLEPKIATIIVGVVQTLFVVVSALLIEKAGRRLLLLQSCISMGLCLTVLGIYFKLKINGTDVSNIGWIPLASVVIFIITFSMGYGPIPWMMMGELFSAECKGIASGLAVILNWLLVFVVTKVFPNMKEKIGPDYTFWVFAAFMLLSVFFVYFFVPETKGKTNAQIQAELEGK